MKHRSGPARHGPPARGAARPSPSPPSSSWEHFILYENVKKALLALPSYFRPEIVIPGVPATDVFALNAWLGATIEEKTVEALNQVRSLWDPEGRYPHFSFIRQTQTFPDVLLRCINADGSQSILMGLELKGWYVLAKEGEPSFRFLASRDACSEADLFVVFPWALSNVISGLPRLYQPYIAPMRYVAEYRNYHWQHSPEVRQPNRTIHSATSVAPYPKKSDAISDVAAVDKGGNFGRIARTGILDDYVDKINQEGLCGIPAQHWRSFFKIFTEGRTAEGTTEAVEAFAARLTARIGHLPSAEIEAIRERLIEIAGILEGR